ncbi:metallophosphoesterase [Butyrivibrio sp. INlla16]|uniref:metallophosphoesterase family protein n=1 Tax=Butyrivibrio sp. INlla16 TaxID=1520807 RepID=UPI0008878A67|nr:metallophosphoesterase [Butyrivibrio sp. INlla16]SDB08217.1 Predicted phosphodiesterase [Butyrivibrio sp. INlla16]
MKIGILSDIHSNIVAFRECIKYLEKEGCDEYIFLGDYVSDTPYTRETMDCLYEFTSSHTCHLLRGNREEYMLGQQKVLKEGRRDQFWRYNSASGNLLFTYEQLTDEDLDFFSKLPITFDYEKTGYPTIKCCHGSPVSSRELIQLGSDEARSWLDKIPCDYMICAHTHFPGEYVYKDKHYMNSGCIGISINDAGFAQCMILEDELSDGKVVWKPTFLKIPYDNKKVVRDMVSFGLLEKGKWFINCNIKILLTGEDRAAEMVALAAKLSEEAGERTVWPEIEEKYFAIAAEEFNIPDYREEAL